MDAQQKEQDSQRKAATAVVDAQQKARQADSRMHRTTRRWIGPRRRRFSFNPRGDGAAGIARRSRRRRSVELAVTHAHHQDDVAHAQTSQAVGHAHHQDDVGMQAQGTRSKLKLRVVLVARVSLVEVCFEPQCEGVTEWLPIRTPERAGRTSAPRRTSW